MFYKIMALHAAGWKIHLHYFQYREGRGAAGLEEFCEEIHSYDRKDFFFVRGFSSALYHQVKDQPATGQQAQ